MLQQIRIQMRIPPSAVLVSLLLAAAPNLVQADVFYCAATQNAYEIIDPTVDYLSWDAARQAAEASEFAGMQGHLAEIESADEQACIDPHVTSLHWLGGFQDLDAPDYSEPAGGWYWITGGAIGYTNWSAGQPDNAPTLPPEDCLHAGTSGWNDRVCNDPADSSIGYVVEYAISQTGVFFCEATGHWYEIVEPTGNYLSWGAARQAAEASEFAGIQGHLAGIESADEQACIDPHVTSLHWLGGFQDLDAPDYSEPAGGWYWITGVAIGYTNWSAGQPDNAPTLPPEDCLHAGTSGWNDRVCNDPADASIGYVVEYGIPQGIPVVGEWGIVVMTLLAMTLATILLARRRSAQA